MADANDPRPGDNTNNLLSKILNRLASDALASAVSVTNFPVSQAVTGPLTDTQLRATAVPVSGTLAVTGPLTDAQLRAATVPVSGTLAVTGPLTDAQLRAATVPVSGTVTATISAGISVISATFQRPNDTNAYAASDVVNDNTVAGSAHVITFTGVVSSNGAGGYITKLRVNTDSTTTTNALFRLYLYSVAPTALADNAQFTLLYANRANRIGHIDFAMNTEGTGSDSANALVLGVNLPFKCAVADTNLYGVLVAKAAYVPTAQENFTVELTTDLN